MGRSEGISTPEAAIRLGITQVSVRQLIDSGQLAVIGRVGRSVLLHRASVERLASTGTRRGRAWAARIAWAALALLSGQNPTWISASEKSRLKKRLSTLDAKAVCVLARNKDRTIRYRATSNALVDLSAYLIASGATAMRDESTAETFGLTGGSGIGIGIGIGIAEGYVMAGDAQVLADSFGLVEDPDGNAIIHEVELEEPFAEGQVPVAAVAVDLTGSLAPVSEAQASTCSTSCWHRLGPKATDGRQQVCRHARPRTPTSQGGSPRAGAGVRRDCFLHIKGIPLYRDLNECVCACTTSLIRASKHTRL